MSEPKDYKQKDPAFLFYSSDWLTGTMLMGFEDKGKYIYLLSVMHQTGRMNEETIRLLVGNLSDALKAKFKIDSTGLFYNERLEFEIEKRLKFTESRRANGKKGGRKPNALPNALPNGFAKNNHTENENEDVSKEKIEGTGERKTFLKAGPLLLSMDINETQIANTIEYIDRLKQTKLTKIQVNDYWKAFKIQYFSEESDKVYNSITDIVQHFRNWLKDQNHGSKVSNANFANSQPGKVSGSGGY